MPGVSGPWTPPSWWTHHVRESTQRASFPKPWATSGKLDVFGWGHAKPRPAVEYFVEKTKGRDERLSKMIWTHTKCRCGPKNRLQRVLFLLPLRRMAKLDVWGCRPAEYCSCFAGQGKVFVWQWRCSAYLFRHFLRGSKCLRGAAMQWHHCMRIARRTAWRYFLNGSQASQLVLQTLVPILAHALGTSVLLHCSITGPGFAVFSLSVGWSLRPICHRRWGRGKGLFGSPPIP